MIPNKIRIKTDNNVLEFVRSEKKGKEQVHLYRYIKSITKKGMELPLTESEINKLLLGVAEILND